MSNGDPGRELLPELPRDEDGPVFAAPWQAQVFAIAVRLHEKGHFTWLEWADHLGAEIAAAREAGDPDTGETYYDHWLLALEKIIAEKGIVEAVELTTRRDAWDRAARATPHGQPIVLGRGE